MFSRQNLAKLTSYSALKTRARYKLPFLRLFSLKLEKNTCYGLQPTKKNFFFSYPLFRWTTIIKVVCYVELITKKYHMMYATVEKNKMAAVWKFSQLFFAFIFLHIARSNLSGRFELFWVDIDVTDHLITHYVPFSPSLYPKKIMARKNVFFKSVFQHGRREINCFWYVSYFIIIADAITRRMIPHSIFWGMTLGGEMGSAWLRVRFFLKFLFVQNWFTFSNKTFIHKCRLWRHRTLHSPRMEFYPKKQFYSIQLIDVFRRFYSIKTNVASGDIKLSMTPVWYSTNIYHFISLYTMVCGINR